MATMPDLTPYIAAAREIDLSNKTPKPNIIHGDPMEAIHEIHRDEDGKVLIGVWECTPGSYHSAKVGYSELMVILGGHATITPTGGEPLDLRDGSAIVTPDGWTGTWDVHDTIRKVFLLWGEKALG